MTAATRLTREAAAALVLPHLPPGVGGSLEPVGEGDFCFAYRAGDCIVRVAKHARAAAAIRREACVLGRIADHLPLEVPRLALHDPDGGPPFTVHEEIRGSVLTRKGWAVLPMRARRRAAERLAEFLHRLHALVSIGRQCGLPVLDEAVFADRLRREAREQLSKLLLPGVRERLDALLARRAERAPGALALLHADLAPGHVLHDEASGDPTGIIDFGDVLTGPPARDFIYLYEDFGVEMCEEVAAAYAGSGAAALMQDVRAWYLFEALSWTLERLRSGSEADVRHGLDEVTREVEA